MGRTFVTLGVGILIAAAGCGGGGPGAGEPLVSGTLAGQYKNQPFTPTSGIATLYMGENLIGFGDGPVNCASPSQPNPPAGTMAYFTLSALDLTTYSSVFVQMIQNKGGFDGIGSNSGTVTITAVSATSVAGNISYSYTDSTTSLAYGITGDFEVTRCP